MFRSVNVDFIDVDAGKDAVGVVSRAAPHGVQVEDFIFFATFLPTHFTLRAFVLVALKRNSRLISFKIMSNAKEKKLYQRILKPVGDGRQ